MSWPPMASSLPPAPSSCKRRPTWRRWEGPGWSALVQIVVTNSLPQAANIALMGDRLEVIDISGQATHLLKLYQTLTFIYRVLF